MEYNIKNKFFGIEFKLKTVHKSMVVLAAALLFAIGIAA